MASSREATEALVRGFSNPTSSFLSDDVFNLLRQGAEPDSCTPDGTPVLVRAVAWGRLATVMRLLEIGASPNYSGTCGIPPLTAALWVDSRPILKVLLKHGANPLALDVGADPGEAPWVFPKETPTYLCEVLGRLVRLKTRRRSGGQDAGAPGTKFYWYPGWEARLATAAAGWTRRQWSGAPYGSR